MEKTADELIPLEKSWAQAFINNDADAIGQFMADDWAIITPDGAVIDKAVFLGIIKSGMLSHEQMDSSEMHVRAYGESAVVTAKVTTKGTFKGQAIGEVERSTDVFVKQGGRWKCVLTHLTRIATK